MKTTGRVHAPDGVCTASPLGVYRSPMPDHDLEELQRALVSALRNCGVTFRAFGDRFRKFSITMDFMANATEQGTVSGEAIGDMLDQVYSLTVDLPVVQQSTTAIEDVLSKLADSSK